MTSKLSKSENKNVTVGKSIRIGLDVQRKAKKILSAANTKKAGRKVKIDQLLNVALDLVTPEHIKTLQDQTLSNEDRKEILRQKYIAIHGQISRDEFTGFMMTAAYVDFLDSQKINSDQLQTITR